MFVDFDPFILLFWVFISSFIPGIMVSFSILRKSGFTSIEKSLIGSGLGLILLPIVPFFAYFFLGMLFSSSLVLASVGLFYLFAIALFIRTKAYEDFGFDPKSIKPDSRLLGSIAILILVLVAFWIRMSSYSPVFQELDPYYYTQVGYQLLEFGENPFDDGTAWHPIEVNHRRIPILSYLEASWFSLYTGGTEPDNMLMANIASMYPPIMAALSFFFLYLFISAGSRREWGVLGAGIASFAPVLISKTLAGEQEAQPYAFFAIAFFIAMYAFMTKTKESRYAVLAGLAFMAVALGSSSQLLVLAMFIIFVILQSLILFLREDDNKELGLFLKHNSIVFIIGPLIGSLIKASFEGNLDFGITDKAFIPIIFGAVLFAIPIILSRYTKFEYTPTNRVIFLGAVLLVSIILFIASPLGDLIKSVGVSGLGIATFKSPLHRTIAEQGVTGGLLSGSMGFIATAEPEWIAWIMAVPSLIGNAIFAVAIGLLNTSLGTDVEYASKSSSLLFLWIPLFFLALAYAFFKLVAKKERNNLALLFAVIILPPVIVGLIKAKYTIYATFMLAAAIAFIFGQTEDLAGRLSRRFSGLLGTGEQSSGTGESSSDSQEFRSLTYPFLLAIAAFLLLSQFLGSYSPILLASSFTPRFQDDPAALQEKFTQLCSETGDADICAAAEDPMGYASQGTNYQYNAKLCYLSLLDSFDNLDTDDYVLIQTRCNRIADYWIESMEWLRYNTGDGSRTTSWWDYGHWINYFGLKDAVLRNEHRSHQMIGEVAHAYISGTPEELASFMRSHDSEYALFDRELISGGGQLGGKYGALNYLSCARNNKTDVTRRPGESICESKNIWEVLMVPDNPEGHVCTISRHGDEKGVIGYRISIKQQGGAKVYLHDYPLGDCQLPFEDARQEIRCKDYIDLEPTYCLGNVVLADGANITGTYYLDKEYPNGDLKLNKGRLAFPKQLSSTYHLGDAILLTMIYDNAPVWLENGEVKSGYEDRKGNFYDSNIYRALFLGNVPGFEPVFSSTDNQVRIFKLKE